MNIDQVNIEQVLLECKIRSKKFEIMDYDYSAKHESECACLIEYLLRLLQSKKKLKCKDCSNACMCQNHSGDYWCDLREKVVNLDDSCVIIPLED